MNMNQHMKKYLNQAQRNLLKKALIGEMEKLEEEEQDFLRAGNRPGVGRKRVQIEDCAVLIQVLTDVEG